MTGKGNPMPTARPTTAVHDAAARARRRRPGALTPRGGRGALMPLAGLAAAAALLAGCGGAEEDPAEAPTSAAVEIGRASCRERV